MNYCLVKTLEIFFLLKTFLDFWLFPAVTMSDLFPKGFVDTILQLMRAWKTILYPLSTTKFCILNQLSWKKAKPNVQFDDFFFS